jgi:alanine racemase
MEGSRKLSWIELSRSALAGNIHSLATLAPGKILAISVKGNAYGHGLKEIVRMVADNDAVGYLTVHSVEEGAQCRAAGWKKNILVLGPVLLDDTDAVFEYDLEPAVFNREFLQKLGELGDQHGRQIKTHLKLETGTNRQGLSEEELPPLAEIYRKFESLQKPYAAYTHFANIEDTTSHEYAEHQLKLFKQMVKKLEALRIKPIIRHTASSAATILFKKTHFEMVRPGISVYGHWPSKETYVSYRLRGGENSIFTPVLAWKARITQLKSLPPDAFIGYGCTYRTTSATRLGILPVGYYDGYSRALSNQAYVLVQGKRAPVRGRICMDITMIDVTDIHQVNLEAEAVLIGQSHSETISAEQLAGWANSINYEVLARLSGQLPRQIVA